MIRSPKKTKYFKYRKGVIKGFETKNSLTSNNFGAFGLKVCRSGRISLRQLEAARKVIVKHTGRQGQLWLRVCPDYPITAKPNESRMGKGKGPIYTWVFRARAGTIIFELEGVHLKIAQRITKLLNSKVPLKFKLVELNV